MKLRILSAARLSFPLASAIAALLAVPSANAAVLTWNNGAATGNWNTADLNWSGASPWSNATPDDAVFGAVGAGTVTLTEAITAGSVVINTAGYTITGSTITLNSGATALTSNATSTVNSNVTLATAAGTITSSVGTLTLGGTLDAGSLALTFDGAGSTTVSNAIANGDSLTKNGAGTLTLSGANSYPGTTVINGGTLTVTGSLNGTTGTALTFGGSGTLNVAEPANSAQGMGVLTLGAGDGAVTSTAAGATSIATLTFGSLAARAVTATANFTLATNTSSTGLTPNKIVFTDTTNVPLAGGSNDPGIFFGGANYARYDAAGFVRAVAYDDTEAPAALTGPGVTTLGATTAATDVQFTGSARATTTPGVVSAANTNTLAVTDGSLFAVGQILTGTNIAANTYITAITGNTLTLTNANVANSIGTAVPAATVLTPYNSVTAQTTASVNTLNLSGVGASLTLGSSETLSINGILRSAGTAVASSVISGGTGLQAAASGGEMVVRANLATDLLTIATPILDNGVSRLTKSGAGTLFLPVSNTYAGGTFLNGGTVRISNATSFGTNPNVTINGSSRITASGGITYANAITVNSGTTLTLQAPTTANNVNTTATFTGVLSGSGNLSLPNSGNNAAQGILDFTNTANTFTGNVVLSASGAGDEHFKFNSIGDGGNFTFAKNGNRQLITYTGASAITFDTRQIVVAATMVNGGATDRQGMDGGGSNPVSIFANDASDSASTITFNKDMVVNNITSTYGVLYFGGSNSGDNTFAGSISDTSGTTKLCIGKFGAGKWILSGSNTYEGNTLISNGTLSVNTIANAATPQPLGIGPAIQLGVGNSGNTGTLSYTGGIASTDKQVVIGAPVNTVNQAAVGSFLNNGSGPLTFTNPTFNPTSTSYIQPGTSTSLPGFVTATRTLTLGGTYADGTNEIQGVIQNNSSVSGTGAGIVGLTVSASNWKLSGANTYTGLTTVNGGTLQLGNAGALGFGGLQRNVATSGTTVSGGGSLDLNGTTAISEPITLNTSSSTALVNSNTSAAASIGSGIAGITLGTAGSGYSAPPTITINGTGTGATAVASLGLTAATFGTATVTGTRTGAVTAVITGGGGTGATATVTTLGLLTITHPGTGYTSAPTITVTVTGGTITYTPNASSFIVTAVQMTNAGSGYTGTPTYTFDSGSATAGVVSRSSVILSANSSIGGAGDMTIDAVVSQSGGAPGLTKVGAGTLTLTAANTYTGNTNVSEGALILADNAQLSFVLGASGINNSITGAGTVTLEGDFNINTTAADGLSSGSWTLENVDTLAGAYGSSFTVTGFTDIGGDKWEKTVGSKIYTFDETTGILTLVTSDPFPAWAASKDLNGTPGFENGKGDDPDGDGFTNLDEFAFDGNPLSGANDGKIVGKIATVGPDQVITLTLPVRNGATFANDGGDQLSALTDGIYYRVEGSLDLSVFANTVTEVTPAITAGLPTLSTGWTYRTFRAPGTVPTVSMTFLRAKASETP